MKSQIVVVTIIEKDGKLLFGKKKKDTTPFPNTWHLIGGRINDGEPCIEALKREVREEASIEITDVEQIGFDEDVEPNSRGEKVHFIFLQFKSRMESGEPAPGDDIVELVWQDKSRLDEININKPTEKLFKRIGLL